MNAPRIAIVGATGAVGQEMLQLLSERKVALESVRLLASARSAGKKVPFEGSELTINELQADSFEDIDIALFSAGGSISKEFAPIAAQAGAIVIDNSSAFRMDADVPLVVPEINGDELKSIPKGIIANPNCTTIIATMALAPLHKIWRLSRVIASSYQAVSGSGALGIAELQEQMHAWAKGQAPTPKVYPKQIVSNCIPMIGAVGSNGYTDEEMKLQNEGRKILRQSMLKASATCVRVPVFRSHAVSLTASFERDISVQEARRELENFPGVRVVDAPERGLFPTPLESSNQDDCLVGRIRQDLVFARGLNFWVVGDQVRKGAALNAVQILEHLPKYAEAMEAN